MNKRIAIIGGGAAGLAAACALGKGSDITIYERNDRVGKKLLSTGNGRCNIVNTNLSPKQLHSKNNEMVSEILGTSPVSEIMTFFENLGLLMRIEYEGRVYPLCNQASAVLDVLRYEACEKGVNFRYNFCVTDIKKTTDGFMLKSGNESAIADIVILACGGMAAPKTGSDGIGYNLAKAFGHSINNPLPALVALKSDTSFTAPLKGIRCKVAVKLVAGKDVITSESGEIQFADYGISGIAAMQLSRHLAKGCRIIIDFAELYNEDYILYRLKEAVKKYREAQDIMTGIVQKRVAQSILKHTLAIAPSTPAGKLSEQDLNKLTKAIKGLELDINGTLKWDNAQITSGGIPLSEITSSMESKLVKNLYITGEMLDCDGECGGYNLGWAWICALRAANSINKELSLC
ncbi:MAG: aminoacetone oxidase family FAD-binding enzyme [Eubacteriales bacterium]|nr:aminoacetone oxidase family FAD-binding enzyme [Eubacteriales bacterium]